jgi:MFS family permease
MLKLFESNSPSPSLSRIAKEMRIIGWTGFWLQLFFGFIPVVFAIFFMVMPNNQNKVGNSGSIGFFFGYATLITLIFTIYWCFRYTRIGQKLTKPDLRPSRFEVTRVLSIGLLVNVAGMIFAVIVAMYQVNNLLVTLLSLPQGSSTIFTPTQGAAVMARVPITPLQMMGLQAVISAIAAQLIGLMVALWLLHRVNQRSSVELKESYYDE